MKTYRVNNIEKPRAARNNMGVARVFDIDHDKKMAEVTRNLEVKKIENKINQIINSNPINKFAYSQGMMKEFVVNGMTIKSFEKSFIINGEQIKDIDTSRLCRIRSLISAE